MVSSSVLTLSVDATKLVEIVQGILSVSMGVKDMNEAWLAEVGLSPAPSMFNLDKMKSDGGAGSGSTAPSVASAPATGDVGVSMVKKRPSSGAEVGLRKRLRKAATEQPVDASGSTARTSADKGKGTVELGEGEAPLVLRWSTISGSSPFWTEGPLSGEYLRVALYPTLAKQVYECSSEELMNRAGNQHEKILALWAANKELKASVGQELAATVERWVKELETEIERIQTELESLRSQRRESEQEVGLLCSSLDGARNDGARLEGDVLSLTEAATLLQAELKAEDQKAVAAYKASRGFEYGLEKMGRVSYKFGYRMALERLQGKHPGVMIEPDPFAECSEDAKIEMDLDQPFDDGTPSEKQLTP
ncbi:hypothetical protein BHM03_00005933 [Ensete ventricosum]|uniref:Uncharacterized protein n=1 Tax=Ensete ventricosum TaxID=4639 RepID=A0A445MBF5_ENSVE|nr:hypothetical protein BHM03_00005933 [Ensete ventricosum]